MSPASPKVRIRSDCENSSATKESPAVAWVSTQAGPTTRIASRNACDLALARDQAVARGEGQLHAVGKADDHDQRRHHIQEHVQPEVEPAERAERQQDGEQRRPAAMIMKETRRKKTMAIRQPATKPMRVVDEPVALDGIADLELHDRHAGQLALRPVPARSSSMVLRMSSTTVGELSLSTSVGIERQNDQRQLAVVREQLAADDLVAHDTGRRAAR